MTVIDVAEKAGVSPSTVSRAFNTPTMLHPETLDRVRQAARDLNFVPNALARGLITGRSGFAALVVPDITDPFFARLAMALDRALRAEGMVLVVCQTSERFEEEAQLRRLLEERQMDGLVWVSEAPHAAVPSPLEASRIPRVVIERAPGDARDDALILDKSGLGEVVDYLVGLGHRRLAMVMGHPQTYGGRELALAFRAAVEARGLALPDDYVVSGDFKFEQSRAAARTLLALDPPPTAVFAGSDTMTHGFMTGLQDLGVRVPDDLSVVAFATALVDALVRPPVTSCQSSYDEAGRLAAQLLIERIQTPDRPAQQVLLPTQLLIRGSCRAV